MSDSLMNLPGFNWEKRRCRPPRTCGKEREHLMIEICSIFKNVFKKRVVVQGGVGSMGLKGKRGKRGERVSNNALLQKICIICIEVC